jgi:hypothetical protein
VPRELDELSTIISGHISVTTPNHLALEYWSESWYQAMSVGYKYN